VASTYPAIPDRRAAHQICDLVREGIPLAAVTKGLGLRDQAIRNAIYIGCHDGPPRYVEFARWVRDAKLERQAIVDRLLADARERLNG
jgi:hypothetical protein